MEATQTGGIGIQEPLSLIPLPASKEREKLHGHGRSSKMYPGGRAYRKLGIYLAGVWALNGC